jgi:hypothetical protein
MMALKTQKAENTQESFSSNKNNSKTAEKSAFYGENFFSCKKIYIFVAVELSGLLLVEVFYFRVCIKHMKEEK